MCRRTALLLAVSTARKQRFSPLVPRVHYWEVPAIMEKIDRWQGREEAVRVSAVSPGAPASSLAPSVGPAAVVDLTTWEGRLKACRVARQPLRIPLEVPKWTENYVPLLLALACPALGFYRLCIAAHLGVLEFLAIFPIALPFRAFRYGTSFALLNPADRREQWLFELKRSAIFPGLSPVVTPFYLKDVDWAIRDDKNDMHLKLRVATARGPPLGRVGRALGMDEYVLVFPSAELVADVKAVLLSGRGRGGPGLDSSPLDEEQIKLQQRKRDYYLLLVGFGVLNMFFFGYILSRLSSTAAVQERGWAGAVRNFFSG
eukprot:EG_transcript_17140